ncbi:MAG: DUF4920 domain-containing protein [Bacteroidota bacterium]
MRYFNILAAAFSMLFVLSIQAQETEGGHFYGKAFETKQASDQVSQVIDMLENKEKVETQFKGKIKEVCQVKGCWMKVALENEEEVFVRFKDYGFFVPTDSSDKDVIINGVVFTSEISVEDQKHYAKDRGDSPAEIAKISKPKKQLNFEADGVLIRN